MPDEPVLTVKDEMVAEILEDLPEGVRNFLDAEVPDPPQASMPTDEASAILVNGICAWYVLELFRPLAGLKLVQIPMFLGQLNSVQHGILLASLEYKEESDAQQDFEIVEPTDGTYYQPGELRITCRVNNGTAKSMSATLGESEFALIEREGVWRQYVDLTDFQAYTLSVTATFDDENETTAQQSITFEICDPENPPEEEELESAEGEDIEALQKAKNEIDSAFKRFMDLAASTTDIDALTNAYQQWKAAIQSFVSIAESALSSPEALNQDKGYLGASYPEVANAIYTYSEGTGSMGDLTLRCGELKSVTDHMMTIIETQI